MPASILIVVGIYSVLVNRLTERYLLEEALPARVLETDIGKTIHQPTLFINQRIKRDGQSADCQTLSELADKLARQMGSFRL